VPALVLQTGVNLTDYSSDVFSVQPTEEERLDQRGMLPISGGRLLRWAFAFPGEVLATLPLRFGSIWMDRDQRSTCALLHSKLQCLV
jgi:hypothetical protein